MFARPFHSISRFERRETQTSPDYTEIKTGKSTICTNAEQLSSLSSSRLMQFKFKASSEGNVAPTLATWQRRHPTSSLLTNVEHGEDDEHNMQQPSTSLHCCQQHIPTPTPLQLQPFAHGHDVLNLLSPLNVERKGGMRPPLLSGKSLLLLVVHSFLCSLIFPQAILTTLSFVCPLSFLIRYTGFIV